MKKAKAPEPSLQEQVQWVLKWLKAHSTKATLDGMSRYAIPSDKAFGVAMKDMKALGKKLGQNHALALALWETGWYEARMVTSFVADPSAITAAQMDRWCKDFDNWAYCDTLSFNLFDRTPHAWAKVEAVEPKEGRVREANRVRAALESCSPRQAREGPAVRRRARAHRTGRRR